MSKPLQLALLCVVCVAQLAVPAWMIGWREWVLEHGAVYKFRTAPIDPYDAFRGRYVWLAFENNTAPYTGDRTSGFYNREMFATIEVDGDGFAGFSAVYESAPDSGDYIRVKADHWVEPDGEQIVHLSLPFDRYYMNEAAAPAAELAYREHSQVHNRDAYATVRVFRGHVVLEQLYVAEVPIEEFLKNPPTP